MMVPYSSPKKPIPPFPTKNQREEDSVEFLESCFGGFEAHVT